MSLAGDALAVHNRKPERVAAQITQDPASTLPALAVGGDTAIRGNQSVTGAVTVGGPLTVGGIVLSGTPQIGQVQVGTSATAVSYQSAMNVGGWVFDVRAYGALGDGQVVTDGAITSGQATLTCATSAPFTKNDVNKVIMVRGAAATGVTTLVTTISRFVSASQVTLAANAGATLASGGLVLWATDDTAAIQKAINAGHTLATAFAKSSNPLYQVYSPPGAGLFYGIGGPLVTGGATLGNGQLTVPINADTNNGITCQIVGVDSGAKTRHWNQTTPQMSGSTWVSFGVFASLTAQNNNANANGTPAMISGPTGVNGYGTNALLFNNVTVHIRNMSLLTTHSSSGFTYSALNLHGCARAILEDVSYGTTGTVPNNDYNAPVGFANGNSIGVVMPANGNNAMNTWHRVICQGGYTYGVYATEHMNIDESIILYCWSGFCPVGGFGDGGSGVGALHAISFPMLAIEGCTQIMRIINPGSSGVGPVLRGRLDTEGNNIFDDSTSGTSLAAATGQVFMSGAGNAISSTSGMSLQVIDDRVAPGPATAVSLTINTAAQGPWRWSTVYLAGGTVTSVQVSNLMGGASAPALTTVYSQASGTLPLMSVRVPPGGWIKVNGSVIPTTNNWVLD